MWQSHTSLGEAVIIGEATHHLTKANIIEKSTYFEVLFSELPQQFRTFNTMVKSLSTRLKYRQTEVLTQDKF